jgi:hypothetical protein
VITLTISGEGWRIMRILITVLSMSQPNCLQISHIRLLGRHKHTVACQPG